MRCPLSTLSKSVCRAANGGAGASPENILGKMKGRMKHGMVLLNEKTGFENV